jgi:hypothetical protein
MRRLTGRSLTERNGATIAKGTGTSSNDACTTVFKPAGWSESVSAVVVIGSAELVERALGHGVSNQREDRYVS